jgi:hypothetical protein
MRQSIKSWNRSYSNTGSHTLVSIGDCSRMPLRYPNLQILKSYIKQCSMCYSYSFQCALYHTPHSAYTSLHSCGFCIGLSMLQIQVLFLRTFWNCFWIFSVLIWLNLQMWNSRIWRLTIFYERDPRHQSALKALPLFPLLRVYGECLFWNIFRTSPSENLTLCWCLISVSSAFPSLITHHSSHWISSE